MGCVVQRPHGKIVKRFHGVLITMNALRPRFREEHVRIIESFIQHHFQESQCGGIVIGMSGGVDSSVVAKLCADSIGSRKLLGAWIGEGIEGPDFRDVREWAKILGIELRSFDIRPLVKTAGRILRLKPANRLAAGNLKARIRMATLYSIANRENRLVMGTGNKSELATGYFCYDSETRALTPGGAKGPSELNAGDLVFSMNLSTQKVEEVPVRRVHVFDYSGYLVRIRTRRLDLLVTPNHRILVSRNHGTGALGFESVESRMNAGTTTIPTPLPWDGLAPAPAAIDTSRFLGPTQLSPNSNAPVTMATEDFLYLMGLHIGDGCANEGSVKATLISDPEEDGAVPLRDAVGRFAPHSPGPGWMRTYKSQRLFIASGEGKRSRGPLMAVLSRYGIHGSTTRSFVAFTNRALFSALAACGFGARNKRIPDWVLSLPGRQLRKLFQGLMDSDGTAEGHCYTTTSETLAYQMVELCAKLGIHANLARRLPKTSVYRGKPIRSRGVIDVRISPVARTLTFGPRNMSYVPYAGSVWCPEVPPYDNLLVERHGRTIFCGNTKYGDGGVDFLPIGDLYKTQVREMAAFLGVPKQIVEKVPTAGLWKGQTDEGELGIRYGDLDRVLLGIEIHLTPDEIAAQTGLPLKKVLHVEGLVAASVHKRKPPLIPKIGIRTFGLDWRE